MPNRVIKDSSWSSPTLAKCSILCQDHFPRWLLMADDWGCFDADFRIIKGLVYPLRDDIGVEEIEAIQRELYENGILFVWYNGERRLAHFNSWDSHHNFCNKTNLDDGGKRQKHRRKTAEPPQKELSEYNRGVIKVWNNLVHLGTACPKRLNPNPNPNPNPKELLTSKQKPVLTPTEFVKIYHDKATSLPRLVKLTASRKRVISARLREKPDPKAWSQFWEYVENNDFLSGRKGGGGGHDRWRATFDWCLKESNFAKILEGNYDNGK